MSPRLARILCIALTSVVLASAGADEKEPAELDVPYEPTHPAVVDAMLDLAGVTDKDFVIDLGCGDGRIVIRAAKRGARGLGVDLDPQRIVEAREIAEHEGLAKLVEFREQDIMQTDIRQASVVTLYLLPAVNVMLRPKLMAELRPGTRIVSHAFDMGEWEADRQIEHARARARTLYLWKIPAGAGGTWHWTAEGKKLTLRLDQQFQKLTGALTWAGPQTIPISDGRVDGETVTFKARVPRGDRAADLVFSGKLAGDKLTGTQEESGKKQPWSAERSAPDLAGVYRITGPSADASGVLKIERQEGRLTATFASDRESQETAVPAFYAWGTSVRFEAPCGNEEFITFTGALDGTAPGGAVSGPGIGASQHWSAVKTGAAGAKAAGPAKAARPSGGEKAGAALGGSELAPAASLDVLQPGQEWVNPRDGSVLVWIPGGEFTMGSDSGPEDERPAHRVRVEGFWLGKYEVTNRQYALYLEAEQDRLPMFWEDPQYNHPDQPVVGVLYTEAAGYCGWAGVRMPTEAEWEYAALSGRQFAYPTATGELTPELANIRGTSGKDRWERTAPVGSFPPTPLGLYDMAGNAWEWTTSRFARYPYVITDGREDQDGGLRVLRGGSYGFGPDYARSRHRHRFSSHLRYDFAGFRVAASPAAVARLQSGK